MKEMLIILAPGLSILVIMLVGGILVWRQEKKEWNKGRCNKCCNKWEHFDMDSQGGIGWSCKCGRTIWTSWIRG